MHGNGYWEVAVRGYGVSNEGHIQQIIRIYGKN